MFRARIVFLECLWFILSSLRIYLFFQRVLFRVLVLQNENFTISFQNQSTQRALVDSNEKAVAIL